MDPRNIRENFWQVGYWHLAVARGSYAVKRSIAGREKLDFWTDALLLLELSRLKYQIFIE